MKQMTFVLGSSMRVKESVENTGGYPVRGEFQGHGSNDGNTI